MHHSKPCWGSICISPVSLAIVRVPLLCCLAFDLCLLLYVIRLAGWVKHCNLSLSLLLCILQRSHVTCQACVAVLWASASVRQTTTACRRAWLATLHCCVSSSSLVHLLNQPSRCSELLKFKSCICLSFCNRWCCTYVSISVPKTTTAAKCLALLFKTTLSADLPTAEP